MRPGSAADQADFPTATASRFQRTACLTFGALHQDAPANFPLWEAAPHLVLALCAEAVDLMLWPMLPDDQARNSLAQSVAMGAGAVGAQSVGRCWP